MADGRCSAARIQTETVPTGERWGQVRIRPRRGMSSGVAEKHQDDYSPDEIAARMLRGLKRALATPHAPQKPKPKKPGRLRKRVLKARPR
jgi:hypothetical protein